MLYRYRYRHIYIYIYRGGNVMQYTCTIQYNVIQSCCLRRGNIQCNTTNYHVIQRNNVKSSSITLHSAQHVILL